MSTKELNSNHWEELQNIALKLAEGVVSQSLSTQPSQNIFQARVKASSS